jgi:hypothetical protein
MRYGRAILAAALSCLTSVFIDSAGKAATIVYDGGPPALTAPTLASAQFMNAASFILSAGANAITGAEWWGSCPFGSCPQTAFDVSVYSDDSGSPGALVASLLTDGGANQVSTGQMATFPPNAPWPEYVYNITFSPLTLTAGAQYWFVIHETAPIPAPEAGWGLDASSSAPSNQRMSIFDGTNWTTVAPGFGPAFNLARGTPAPVPELSAWMMMLLGFGGLSLVGYRAPRLVARGSRT